MSSTEVTVGYAATARMCDAPCTEMEYWYGAAAGCDPARKSVRGRGSVGVKRRNQWRLPAVLVQIVLRSRRRSRN
eukprot:753319-Rhodomonas_salina.1